MNKKIEINISAGIGLICVNCKTKTINLYILIDQQIVRMIAIFEYMYVCMNRDATIIRD